MRAFLSKRGSTGVSSHHCHSHSHVSETRVVLNINIKCPVINRTP